MTESEFTDVRITVNERLLDALVKSGRLQKRQRSDWLATTRAVQKLIRDFIDDLIKVMEEANNKTPKV